METAGINMEKVKRQNRASILHYVNDTGPVSRKDIAEKLGLTPAAVTQICTELIEKGILIERGRLTEEKRAGRKKVLLAISYNYKYVYGIHIGPEKTVIALTNLKGEVRLLRMIATSRELDAEHFLHAIAEHCKKMQEEAFIPDEQIAGAGVCLPGIVDRERGRSIQAYGIWKEEVAVGKLLSLFLKIPVVLENSMIAFARAELLYGAGRECDNLFFVKWGADVESALMMNKKIYEGCRDAAGQLGHFVVKKNGKVCECGRRGCLEKEIAFTSIKERIGQVFSYEDTPKLYAILGGDFRNFTTDVLPQVLENQDEPIQKIMENLMDMFARVIVNSITLLAPERVVLCGEFFAIDQMREAFIQTCSSYEPRYGHDMIVYTGLSDRERYIAPVAVFVNEYLKEF